MFVAIADLLCAFMLGCPNSNGGTVVFDQTNDEYPVNGSHTNKQDEWGFMIVPYEPSLLPTFLNIAKQFHVESRFRDVPFAQDKVTKLLSNPNAFCALYKVADNYVGGMLGLVQEHWFTRSLVGFDLGLYILPAYRAKTSAPVRLVRAFEAFCESKGCFEIGLSSSAQIHEKRALRLYESMGYKPSGFVSHKTCRYSQKVNDVYLRG